MNSKIEVVKASDLYETPPEIFHWCEQVFGPFDLDVCCQSETRKVANALPIETHDALEDLWSAYGRRAWCNPPYSDPRPWLEKAAIEAKRGVRTTFLLPGDTSTKWWQECIEDQPFVYVRRLPKRVRFLLNGERAGSPTFPSVVVVFFPRIDFPRSRANKLE